MRFVATNCLREGMILGKTLYGLRDQVLLTVGTSLTKSYISRISRLKYNGIYIEDDLSRDIEVSDVISGELKQKTVRGIKQIFIEGTFGASKEGIKKQKNSLTETKEFVENIIEEILNNKNAMVNMVDLKLFDEYTYYHSASVTVLAIVLGVALKFTKEELYKLGLSALLHDIGKIFVPLEILNKPGKLTAEEFEIIKTHSEAGYKYVKEAYDVPITSYVGILHHHEKYDGKGYPDRRSEEKISLFGRIISVCDVYDALTSDRPYRRGMLPSEAMEYIMAGSGTQFDPELVKIFVRKVAPYPIGTCVKLSNNFEGIVVENYEDYCMRPKVKIYKENDKSVESYLIDLVDAKHSHITIVEVISI
jgi:HD-GYP domain-containing protein (c-di-GMP phosphodiesterase class II)